jgi:hypothetical protein
VTRSPVETDAAERPSRLRFAPNYNVVVAFVDRHIAEGRGAKVAIRTADNAITYAELAANVNRCAGGLVRLGLARGERVLMVVKDCPAFFYLFWGAIKAGIVPVPLNTLLRSSSYTFMIDDSSAAAVVYSPEFAGEVEPAIAAAARPPRYVLRTEGEGQSLAALLAQSQPQFEAVPATAEDDCFWLYSSGSTGAPKGAVAQLHFIDDRERMAADFEQPGPLKLTQHLADMHRGQPGGVRDIPLAQWKLHRIAVSHAALGKPIRQIQDQPGDPLVGRATAKIERDLIDLGSLLEPDLRNLFQEIGRFEQKRLEVAALELAVTALAFA